MTPGPLLHPSSSPYRYFQGRASLPNTYWLGYQRRSLEEGWRAVTDGSSISNLPSDEAGTYAHWGTRHYQGDVPGTACARASSEFAYDLFTGDLSTVDPNDSSSLQSKAMYQTVSADTKYSWAGVACGTMLNIVCKIPADLFACPPPAPPPPPPPRPPSPPAPPAPPTCAPPNNATLVCDATARNCWAYNPQGTTYLDALNSCTAQGGSLAAYR